MFVMRLRRPKPLPHRLRGPFRMDRISSWDVIPFVWYGVDGARQTTLTVAYKVVEMYLNLKVLISISYQMELDLQSKTMLGGI